jgi:hypothetical protein
MLGDAVTAPCAVSRTFQPRRCSTAWLANRLSQLVSEASPRSYLRATTAIAFVFGACALAAVLGSAFVMASRPWGCSANSYSPLVTCDWVTSRVNAALWLVANLAVCSFAWRRWNLPLAVISGLLIAVGIISVIGVFTMAPAAFWFACALWLWAHGRRWAIVLCALVSVMLIYLAATGVLALLALHSTPV